MFIQLRILKNKLQSIRLLKFLAPQYDLHSSKEEKKHRNLFAGGVWKLQSRTLQSEVALAPLKME